MAKKRERKKNIIEVLQTSDPLELWEKLEVIPEKDKVVLVAHGPKNFAVGRGIPHIRFAPDTDIWIHTFLLADVKKLALLLDALSKKSGCVFQMTLRKILK